MFFLSGQPGKLAVFLPSMEPPILLAGSTLVSPTKRWLSLERFGCALCQNQHTHTHTHTTPFTTLRTKDLGERPATGPQQVASSSFRLAQAESGSQILLYESGLGNIHICLCHACTYFCVVQKAKFLSICIIYINLRKLKAAPEAKRAYPSWWPLAGGGSGNLPRYNHNAFHYNTSCCSLSHVVKHGCNCGFTAILYHARNTLYYMSCICPQMAACRA